MEQAGPTPTWIKIQEGYLRSKDFQTHISPPSPGFQCQEHISSQLLDAKTSRDGALEEAAGALSSSSWRTHTQTHLLRLSLSELQQWGGSSKGTSGIQGETEVSGIRASRGHCSFAELSPPPKVDRLVPHLKLHLPD